MKEIGLTKGKVALVDDDMFEELCAFKWHVRWNGWNWYARRSVREGNRVRAVSMHRQIMGAQQGQQVDHRNGKGLDNQRHNLRFCTNSQNRANAKKRARCSSNYKGVCWNKQTGKWQARIKLNGKQIWLGRFDNEIDAALAYNGAATKYFGEFARLSVIEER